MTARFFQRPYPSANSVLLTGPRPVLVDTGFGADTSSLLAWLAEQGVAPETLRVVNTHHHCDHAGGNALLQSRFGVPVLTNALEAAAVNARDPDACRAAWLQQPIEPYVVTGTIAEGDVIETGVATWQVVVTPGHTPGHLSLWHDGVLVLGDALHDADLGWLDPWQSPGALDQTAATLDRLSAIPAQMGYSGHGPAIANLPGALDRARRRLESWREDPARIAWHAAKRIFAHNLMVSDGLAEPELAPGLMGAPWFRDHAEALGFTPGAFVPALVQAAVRADAVTWRQGRLYAVAAHIVPPTRWATGPIRPADWPQPSSRL